VGTRHPSESKVCVGPSKTHLACGAWGGPMEKLLWFTHVVLHNVSDSPKFIFVSTGYSHCKLPLLVG
jgi:hypothetical protein